MQNHKQYIWKVCVLQNEVLVRSHSFTKEHGRVNEYCATVQIYVHPYGSLLAAQNSIYLKESIYI